MKNLVKNSALALSFVAAFAGQSVMAMTEDQAKAVVANQAKLDVVQAAWTKTPEITPAQIDDFKMSWPGDSRSFKTQILVNHCKTAANANAVKDKQVNIGTAAAPNMVPFKDSPAGKALFAAAGVSIATDGTVTVDSSKENRSLLKAFVEDNTHLFVLKKRILGLTPKSDATDQLKEAGEVLGEDAFKSAFNDAVEAISKGADTQDIEVEVNGGKVTHKLPAGTKASDIKKSDFKSKLDALVKAVKPADKPSDKDKDKGKDGKDALGGWTEFKTTSKGTQFILGGVTLVGIGAAFWKELKGMIGSDEDADAALTPEEQEAKDKNTKMLRYIGSGVAAVAGSLLVLSVAKRKGCFPFKKAA